MVAFGLSSTKIKLALSKKQIMKKHLITITGLFIATIFILSSCENSVDKKEHRKDGIVVGDLSQEKSSGAKVTISLDQASEMMDKYNRLTQEWFNYTYTRAWIETIKMNDGKINYYLGVEATLEPKNNSKAYSCYTIYTELEKTKDDLVLYPDAYQQSCRGKCCNSCKLVLQKDNTFTCECESPIEDSDCNGKSSCGHSESKPVSKEQAKNDMI